MKKKELRSMLQLLPSAVIGLMVMVGLATTDPVFDEINWPEIPVFALDKDAAETESQEETESETETAVNRTGNFEDGIYYGKGIGYAGEVRVEVIVLNHQISEITISDHKDTPSFFDKALAVVDRVICAQTWEVDSVSGATYSSRGILEAIENALTGKKSSSSVQYSGNKSEKIKEDTYEEKALKDGVYIGSAKGFGGQIKVQVTIENGRITDITVLDHSRETESYYQKALAIISRILNKQSPNVETISGATYSSNGICEAVKNALNKATAGAEGLDVTEEETEEEVIETESAGAEAVVKGVPEDGTYSAFCKCPVYDYVVYITSTFSDGLLRDISMTTDNDTELNETFILQAWDEMKARLMEHQDGDVDTVSGATYTSSAIRDAYINTLNMATEENFSEDAQESETETETEAESEIGSVIEKSDDDIDTDQELIFERSISDQSVTYTGYINVDAQDASNIYARGAFENYRIKMTIVFENGVLKSMEVLEYDISTDVSDSEYDDDVYYTGYALSKTASKLTDQENPDVDVISGATCSSKAMNKFYLAAKNDYIKYINSLEEKSEAENTPETETETESDEEMTTMIASFSADQMSLHGI